MSEENNLQSEKTAQAENNPKPDKAMTKPIILAVSVFIAAAIISPFGINAHGLVAGTSTPAGVGDTPANHGANSPVVLPGLESGAFPKLPAGEKERAALAQRGEQLERQQCSACHMLDDQFIGPSYKDIVNNGDSRLDPEDLLVLEINHPASGWSSYPRGPQFNLPGKDRLALAFWIVQSVQAGGKQN